MGEVLDSAKAIIREVQSRLDRMLLDKDDDDCMYTAKDFEHFAEYKQVLTDAAELLENEDDSNEDHDEKAKNYYQQINDAVSVLDTNLMIFIQFRTNEQRIAKGKNNGNNNSNNQSSNAKVDEKLQARRILVQMQRENKKMYMKEQARVVSSDCEESIKAVQALVAAPPWEANTNNNNNAQTEEGEPSAKRQKMEVPQIVVTQADAGPSSAATRAPVVIKRRSNVPPRSSLRLPSERSEHAKQPLGSPKSQGPAGSK